MVRVSVVIPTYRRPELLLRCIAALAEQDLSTPDFEVIIVSDGPDRETLVALQSRAAKRINLRYLPLPEQCGFAAARNHGWQQAHSDLIVFTSDDALPEPQWLNSYLSVWRNAVIGAYAGKIIVARPRPSTEHELNIAKLETAEFSSVNCACTKQALYLVDGFDERFTMNHLEDTDLQFKLIKAKISIIKTDDAIVNYPVPGAHWGTSVEIQKKTLFNALLFKNHRDLYRKKIKGTPRLSYYVTVFLFFFGLISLFSQYALLALLTFIFWSYFVLRLTMDRLLRTSNSAGHIIEIFFTSILLPFSSVYWHICGMWRYGVWFI